MGNIFFVLWNGQVYTNKYIFIFNLQEGYKSGTFVCFHFASHFASRFASYIDIDFAFVTTETINNSWKLIT